MSGKVVSKEPLSRKYSFDKYKTQDVCDKAVDAFLPALKFVPSWFVTTKIIEKPDNDNGDDIDLISILPFFFKRQYVTSFHFLKNDFVNQSVFLLVSADT